MRARTIFDAEQCQGMAACNGMQQREMECNSAQQSAALNAEHCRATLNNAEQRRAMLSNTEQHQATPSQEGIRDIAGGPEPLDNE